MFFIFVGENLIQVVGIDIIFKDRGKNLPVYIIIDRKPITNVQIGQEKVVEVNI